MYRAYWQFYKTIVPFITAFSSACMLFGNLYWSLLLFATVGPFIGIMGFKVFYTEQFYFYFNIGHTYSKLIKVSFITNFLIGIPIFGILILTIAFFLGSFSIT